MSIRTFQQLLFLFAILGSAGAVRAAEVGTAFTYQGQLTDGGSPADGVYDLQFKLYDAETEGTQQGNTLTVEDIVVVNGLFKVDLDFGAAVFAGEARFVEIGVRPGDSDGAFTLIEARQRLSPTPYAIHAASAATLSGVKGRVKANNLVSSNSRDWEDVPDMSLEVVTGQDAVLIMFTASISFSWHAVPENTRDFLITTSPASQVRVLVDGQQTMLVAGITHTFTLTCLEHLSPGNHSIKIQWKATGTSGYYNVTGYHGDMRSLTVIEL